jgi:hypothetical protein
MLQEGRTVKPLCRWSEYMSGALVRPEAKLPSKSELDSVRKFMMVGLLACGMCLPLAIAAVALSVMLPPKTEFANSLRMAISFHVAGLLWCADFGMRNNPGKGSFERFVAIQAILLTSGAVYPVLPVLPFFPHGKGLSVLCLQQFYLGFFFYGCLLFLFLRITQRRMALRGPFLAGLAMGLFAAATPAFYRLIFSTSTLTVSTLRVNVIAALVQLAQILVFALSLGIAVCWFRKPGLISATAKNVAVDDLNETRIKSTESAI